MEFEPFLTVLAVTLPISLMGIYVAKLYRKNAEIDPDITRKRLKQMGEYIHDLEAKVRSKTNKINSMQAGPKIEGNIDDVGGLISSLVPELTKHMPKWLSSIVTSNPELLKEGASKLKEYADKNPEQVKQILERFVKNKPTTATTESDPVQGL